MLNLIFQTGKAKDKSKVCVDSRDFFSLHKKKEWFEDHFVRRIIREVDHAEVIRGFVLENDEGEAIPPEYLSTGAKTAICVYEFADMIFNATQMGDNAFKFVIELSRKRDITILVYRDLPYNGLRGISLYKDYEKAEYADADEFYELMDEWLKEIMND